MNMIKIIIWGVGEIEKEFCNYLNSNVEIIAYVDTNKKEEYYKNKRVYTPDELFECTYLGYDYIVIASVYSNDIYKKIHNYKIEYERLIFLRPFQMMSEIDAQFRGINAMQCIAPDYINIAMRESGVRMGIDSIVHPFCNEYPLYQWDYFRYRTFELIADTINKLPGEVAEAGVFKGFFSKLINSKFPNNKLYLFDSFEGFEHDEALLEKAKGHCNQEFIEIFKDTSADKVIEKMPHKDKCIIKKGFFPESAVGIEEKFKFVSIDFDFENSIYDALEWFYPRMVKGGYIFIHDYNEPTLKGVKKAVVSYEQKYGELIKIPIADKCGTIIVYKL